MKFWSWKKILALVIAVLFVIGSIFCGGPFGFIDTIVVRPIVNVLFVIFNWVHDFGLAIIIFTVIVKTLMLPLTIRQLRQTKLMRKIQPELTQIRKNCNGNKQMESLQTMDLYKRYNVKPFASIAVLLIQLPIFIAMFGAIRVIATPQVNDNLTNRAYDFVAYEGSEIKTLEDKQIAYLAAKSDENLTEEEKQNVEYDFHPTLFGVINLNATASDLIRGKFSWSAVVMLFFAIAASVAQYFATKMQMPTEKTKKSKKFREILNDAKAGKEIDDSEITSMTTGQMNKMMPLMMFIIMFSLPGALAFYYFLSNMITILQQKIIFSKMRDDMDDNTDKAILKELKKTEGGKKMRGKIQEAEVVENKKTGTKITRISAKDIKKKRR